MKVKSYGRLWDVYSYDEAIALGVPIITEWRKSSIHMKLAGQFILTDDWYVIPVTSSSAHRVITPFGTFRRSWLYAWYQEWKSKSNPLNRDYQDEAYIYRSRAAFNRGRTPSELMLTRAIIESEFNFRKAIHVMWDIVDCRTDRNYVLYCYTTFIQELLMDTIKTALENSGVRFADQVQRLNQLATDLELIVSQVAAEPSNFDLSSVSGMAKTGGELSAGLLDLFERVYYERGIDTMTAFKLPDPKSAPELPEKTNYEEVKDAI